METNDAKKKSTMHPLHIVSENHKRFLHHIKAADGTKYLMRITPHEKSASRENMFQTGQKGKMPIARTSCIVIL